MTKVNLEAALDAIENISKPISIFLYGSQARMDATNESDYEIGILFPKNAHVGRTTLKTAIQNDHISAYPFLLDQFEAGNPDTPFNKNIFLHELITSGKTLRGEKIIETMQAPNIKSIDLLSEVQFNLGYALAATIAHRNGDNRSANMLFYKSCLFGTRALIMHKTESFPVTYDEILSASKKLELGKYSKLIKAAYQARHSHKFEPKILFKNISYLNQFVIPEIRTSLEKDGDKVVIG